MSLKKIQAQDLLHQIASFDTVIDARSEDEYLEDHLPGAVNWPTLNNHERQFVGTTYKQINAFEAKKHGAAMAASNISRHIQQNVLTQSKDWKPLAYCWRGGKRSGSLALVLDQIGFQVTLLEGGYKAFRAAMLLDIPRLAGVLHWQVICGTTGSGKTRLLSALSKHGAQVLDLEGLANHRSSVLGALPGVAQPSQKRFDMLIWDALRKFDPDKPVYVESESKKVGNVAIPTQLIEIMRNAECLNLVLPETGRLALLMEDYDFFLKNPEVFCERLDALIQLRGKKVIDEWKLCVMRGDFEPVVRSLLSEHYDPIYIASMERNFSRFGTAKIIAANDHSVRAMEDLAKDYLASL